MGGDNFKKRNEVRRFFVEGLDKGLTSVKVSGDEFIHLKRVLRLSKGSEVTVFDGKGLELDGTIESVEGGYALVKVTGAREGFRESRIEITLIQGLLKGDKPEFVVQKATELGVDTISFFTSERTVPLPDKGLAKGLRWRKAAVEAAKQCGRPVVPDIKPPAPLKDALSSIDCDLRLMLWEGGSARSIKELLSGSASRTVALLVGPEGGFSEEEVRLALQQGFSPVGLGPRILRAETAAVSAVSIIQFALGDLG